MTVDPSQVSSAPRSFEPFVRTALILASFFVGTTVFGLSQGSADDGLIGVLAGGLFYGGFSLIALLWLVPLGLVFSWIFDTRVRSLPIYRALIMATAGSVLVMGIPVLVVTGAIRLVNGAGLSGMAEFSSFFVIFVLVVPVAYAWMVVAEDRLRHTMSR
jgi:hypothetical protein